MSRASLSSKKLFSLIFWAIASVSLLVVLNGSFAGLSPLGVLLDPLDGLYRTARNAEHPSEQLLLLDALEAPVTVTRDDRAVPHIFAQSDRDAIIALGYVVAQDRLFQLDFIPRVASGRLSEVFGPGSLETDRFLRRTGMDWAAKRITATIKREAGLELAMSQWFAAGANTYIDGLEEQDLPFEFRLFGHQPERYSALHAARLMEYFAYDLTYGTDAADYSALKEKLGPEAYAQLFPRHSPLSVPIIPERGGMSGRSSGGPLTETAGYIESGRLAMERLAAMQQREVGSIAEGFIPGKGSNNWVVSGATSSTGAPILAGDMHLRLTLPAIWYEAHMVTPTMNTYGVMAPGTPLPVEAFNDHLGWAFTNTGADVIDHYALDLDESGMRYRYEDGWRDLDAVIDTIHVKGHPPVIDTLYYAHWGPVVMGEEGAVATRWVAHEQSHTLTALWGMNHARNLDEFNAALEHWDTPAQNIVYGDVEGNIAIRSTGYLPIRKAGHGVGLLDGSTDAFAWTGRVPFDELPHSINPEQGFLSSTNQQPADSTYPHYLGHDWRSIYRSMRIDTLLRGKQDHSVDDLKRYQADVHAVQRDLFVPLLDTLTNLSIRADTLRLMLSRWSGETGVDRAEPLVLYELLRTLRAMTWDEPIFNDGRLPGEAILYGLLREDPEAAWLDVQGTDQREGASDLLRRALEATVDTLDTRYGWDRAGWRWGDHHKVVLRHLTQSAALRALWRGPLEYPGFASSLSPAAGHTTTHSASWRVVVDFSQSPPVGYGVYPGGQSGNPFSMYYDMQVPAYVQFDHYDLLKPSLPEAIDNANVSSRLRLSPK